VGLKATPLKFRKKGPPPQNFVGTPAKTFMGKKGQILTIFDKNLTIFLIMGQIF
jgi:hypothetical protein